ncbi:MAG: site-specific integrase [Acidibrevibacterium sp.]|uniref:site-specific integrase n=1 Tax=Acidibrevibacterium sp. TaxID=2606776 RepID=UPI003D07FDE7
MTKAGQIRLTDTAVKALKCPPGKRDCLVFDDRIPGFGVRVMASGVKTFLLQYQLGGRGGRRERYAIGRHMETRIVDGAPVVVTAAWARAEAERARGLVRDGRSPNTARASAPKQRLYTFGRLVDDWRAEALTRASLRYRDEAPASIRRFFAELLPRAASSLVRAQVREIVQAHAPGAPIGTRRAVSAARAAFNWALNERDLKAAGNPFERVNRGTEESRQRVLTDAELGEAWRAALALAPPFGPFVQLLILTLQRRSELAGMRWDELAPDFSVWTLPAARAKNSEAHLVHLVEAAREVLRRLPRGAGSPLVFPATRSRLGARAAGGSAARPISGFSDAKERLLAQIRAERAQRRGLPLAETPAPDWRFHDLRRTGVTMMARLGISPTVADRILNHVEQRKATTIAEVYQRHQFLPEREAAMEIWAAHVLRVAAATAPETEAPRRG